MLQLRQRLRELRLRHFLTTSITVSLLSSEMCRRSRTFRFRSYNRKKKKNTNFKLKQTIGPEFISSISPKGPQPRRYRWFPVGFKRVFSSSKCNVISLKLQALTTVFHSLTGFFFLHVYFDIFLHLRRNKLEMCSSQTV